MEDSTTTTADGLRGRTVPSLLDEALAERPSPRALNDWTGSEWRPLSTAELAARVEAFALGLRDLGLSAGERVALLMESDSSFCVADLGSLLAGLVDVPLYLTNSAEMNAFVLGHSGASALVLSSAAQLEDAAALVHEAVGVELVIVADPGAEDPPAAPAGWPERARLISLRSVEEGGRAVRQSDPEAAARLREELRADALATLIYTSGTTGQPKGVELTHENLSSNAIGAFRAIPEVRPGELSSSLSFLPLTHAFGRTLYYGFLRNGNPIWFTQAQLVGRHLREVRPTVFAAVPRVLERVWERILTAGHSLTGWKRTLFDRALAFGERFDPARRMGPLERLERFVLDLLVFRRWRAAVGGRVDLVISGGAALRPEIERAFLAARIPICQGYGLTEASPILATNAPSRNRLGTVGPAIPGVELRIAEDGEVLGRGPGIMTGYYRDAEATAEALAEGGWLRTGDVGELDADGFLRITDRKKDLFKLSTGKYVSPAPIEQRLAADPLVGHAVVAGPSRKYCTALLFPSLEALRAWARRHGLPEGLADEELLARPEVAERLQETVDATNAHLSEWECVKRFGLVAEAPSIENGLLTPTLKVRRRRAWEAHGAALDRLYHETDPARAPVPQER